MDLVENTKRAYAPVNQKGKKALRPVKDKAVRGPAKEKDDK